MHHGVLCRQCPPLRAFTLPSQGAEMATKPATYLCLHRAHNRTGKHQNFDSKRRHVHGASCNSSAVHSHPAGTGCSGSSVGRAQSWCSVRLLAAEMETTCVTGLLLACAGLTAHKVPNLTNKKAHSQPVSIL